MQQTLSDAGPPAPGHGPMLVPPVPATGPVPWPREEALQRLADMIRIRKLEERCAQLYGEQKIRGFLHLCIGQEAIAAGLMPVLLPQDAVVATYREHGHALLRGVSMAAIMAEMMGRREGCSGGRGGSMHLFDRKTRFHGGNAIVGAGLPLAVGLALAEAMQQRQALAACFFGEGAVAEGAFHESMNLAALWRLPVLFCCENNHYAMGTALTRSQSQTDLCVKASAYGMPASHVDGMDVVAVREAGAAAAAFVRSGGGPMFLALNTYRFRAHSMFDPEQYRSRIEVEAWRVLDPIGRYRERLRRQGLLETGDEQAIERAAEQELDAAVAFAQAGSLEPVAELLRDLVAAASMASGGAAADAATVVGASASPLA